MVQLTEEQAKFEISKSWELASTKGVDLKLLQRNLGFLLFIVPEKYVTAVEACIINCEKRMMFNMVKLGSFCNEKENKKD